MTGAGLGLLPANGVYPRVVAAAEAAAERALATQRDDGGVRDIYEIAQPGATAGLVRTLAAAYLCPESRFHRRADFLPRLERAVAWLIAAQHPDGTVDLPTTNFASPPDVAFVLEPLAVCLEVLRIRRYAETRALEGGLERFMRQAAGALVTGGIHTPNHRWVVVAALARCHRLFPSAAYLRRIEQWLAEGIDQDADGHYTERSPGVYNVVTNNALLTAARLLDRPKLLDHVRRNLEATLYLMRPNGELCTEISRRQDRFARATLAGYWRALRWLGRQDGNGRLAAAADFVERTQAADLGGELIYLLETPELREDSTPRGAIPDDYDRYWPGLNFAHLRRGQFDATLLGDHSRFFSFRHAGAVVESVRIASAFFGKGQFTPSLSREGRLYVLEQYLEGPYYQPLRPEDRRPDGSWDPTRAKREQTNIQKLTARVEAQEIRSGFELRIDLRGTDRVPVAIEVTLRPGGKLTGAGLAPVSGLTDAHLLAEDYALYGVEGRAVRIGPGIRRHAWTQLRGAEPRLDGVTLYLTDFTPVSRALSVVATKA